MSPGTFVKTVFEEIKTRNPAYTMRAFSRDLGTSPSTISRIFGGQRDPSLQTLNLVMVLGKRRVLPLDTGRASMNGAHAKAQREQMRREEANSRIPSLDIRGFDAVSLLSLYDDLRILELLPQTKADLAARIGLTQESLESAFVRLFSIGLIEVKGEQICKCTGSVDWKSKGFHKNLAQMYKTYFLKMENEIQKPRPDQRALSLDFFVLNVRQLGELRGLIDEFRLEAIRTAQPWDPEKSAGSNSEKLYQLGIQLTQAEE